MKQVGDRIAFGSGTAGVIIAIEGTTAIVRLDYYNTTRAVQLDAAPEPAPAPKKAAKAAKPAAAATQSAAVASAPAAGTPEPSK